ncbi:MAG: YkgJ family cysteine cluster protein [Candidatus Bathyarchaeota archaeon]|nr:YkgJ family cysteine cluster protein [Candidatus Bathyarchaeum tardum]WGM89243.1 MAG: YkgJ family cysteine cluster protein [Candidatus Bathyarchaeum tardum]WNZ28521.1 MAG: YkgJ family cysteine cluster protein [Candidatus Bathyarchaeota archaeon]
MNPVTWRTVKSWSCVGCGMCCKDYHVVLNFNEWISIVKHYGAGTTIPTPSKLLLGKRSNGTCCFLNQFKNTPSCGLQHAKPLACKIWPFKVFDEPKFGQAGEALFLYRGRNLYVYVDPECTGINKGAPTTDFKFKILPEFIDVALGLRQNQYYSTSKTRVQPFQQRFRGRTVI